jgi:gluconokinase
MTTPSACPVVVVMGITGSGKSTVAPLVAELLSAPFVDGDSFHSAEAVAKMRSGHPLTDADRAPWLDAIGRWLRDAPCDAVATCSALRRRYRDVLRSWRPEVFYVHLAGSPVTVTTRVGARHGHFMPASLVASQVADLEPLQPDEAGVTIDFDQPPDEVARSAADAFRLYVAGVAGGPPASG